MHAALAPRHAAPPHRAHIAARLPCADGRAEIHQRLRVDADVVLGKQALCEPPQLHFDVTLPRPAFDAVAAREHALDVAVENRSAAAEGERGDRRGARAPDAVWVPRILPGKPFAPVTALPGDEKACESGHARILMGTWATPSSASANTTPSWRQSGTTCMRTPSWGSRRPVPRRWWRTSWQAGASKCIAASRRPGWSAW